MVNSCRDFIVRKKKHKLVPIPIHEEFLRKLDQALDTHGYGTRTGAATPSGRN